MKPNSVKAVTLPNYQLSFYFSDIWRLQVFSFFAWKKIVENSVVSEQGTVPLLYDRMAEEDY